MTLVDKFDDESSEGYDESPSPAPSPTTFANLLSWASHQPRQNECTCWCRDIEVGPLISALNTLARLKSNTNDFSESLIAWNQTLTLLRKARGSGHPDVGRTLNAIGVTLSRMGALYEYQALMAFEEALKVQQSSLGPGDEETAETAHNMWLLLHNVRCKNSKDALVRKELHCYKGVDA